MRHPWSSVLCVFLGNLVYMVLVLTISVTISLGSNLGSFVLSLIASAGMFVGANVIEGLVVIKRYPKYDTAGKTMIFIGLGLLLAVFFYMWKIKIKRYESPL